MDCEQAQQKIALYAYGELPDDQCHLLEGHLATCKACQDEFGAVQALQQAMSLSPVQEPSPNLVAQARLRLEEALDSVPRNSWLTRVQQSMAGGLSVLGRAPVAASALLVCGLASGGWAGYESALRHKTPSELPAIAGASRIANITSIERQPNTENVAVHFNRLIPETTQGSLDDPQIRELLLLGAQGQANPGVAGNSVNLLADECLNGHHCSDGPIRNALLVALRYDNDTRVRLNALNGLKPYVAEDMRVRDAVAEALMEDRDATVRARAIEVLQPVDADSSVREVLHTVAAQDDNPHIRTVSREVLGHFTQIQ